MISIVVPVYKVEKYLNRCVDSILNQTYTDFECILVDDGSPDKCGQICDEYAELDKRIRVIHKENGGLSDARNVGIDAAKGEYILFVDSDDWIHPQLIELTLKIIIKEKADVVSYDYKKVNNAGNLPFYDVDEEIGKVTTYSREYIIENLYNEYMQ